MNAQTFFSKGSEIIKAAGLTISLHSVCQPDYVLVFSREAKNVMPKVDYLAFLRNGEWVEEVHSN